MGGEDQLPPSVVVHVVAALEARYLVELAGVQVRHLPWGEMLELGESVDRLGDQRLYRVPHVAEYGADQFRGHELLGDLPPALARPAGKGVALLLHRAAVRLVRVQQVGEGLVQHIGVEFPLDQVEGHPRHLYADLQLQPAGDALVQLGLPGMYVAVGVDGENS